MKVQNPIIGRARGSAGGMTFCKNYDKNVARAKAFEVSNPKTQAQQTQRAFFASLTALCSDFSDDQLRFLFPSKPKTMSRRNALSKQIAQSYDVNGTEKTIDYADIDTLGNAPVMDFGNTSCEFYQSQLVVNINDSVSDNPALAPFLFTVAFVNATAGQIVICTTAAPVADSELTMDLPAGWKTTDSVHAIPLILNVKGVSSTPITFGTMIVNKRPARKND